MMFYDQLFKMWGVVIVFVFVCIVGQAVMKLLVVLLAQAFMRKLGHICAKGNEHKCLLNGGGICHARHSCPFKVVDR